MRSEPRTPTRIRATVRFLDRRTAGTVLNLSQSGALLYMRDELGMKVGDDIGFETDELGHLSGQVRWVRFPRIGVRLSLSSNTAAKMTSFFRSRPTEPPRLSP